MKNHFWFSRNNVKNHLDKYDLVDLNNTSFVMDFETSNVEKIEEYRIVIITYALLSIKRKFVEKFNGKSQVWEKGKDLFKDSLKHIINIVKRYNSKSKKIDIWFNNSSRYDGEFIMDWLVESGFVQSFDKYIFNNQFKMVAGNDIGYLQFEIKMDNYVFVIRDLLRFTTLSIDKLGKIVGVSKKTDIGRKYYESNFTKLNQNEIDEYVDYAITDIKVMWEGFQLFNKFIDLNTNKMTIPSYALDYWKKIEIDKKKYLKIDSVDYNMFSYFGGYSNVNYRIKNKLVEGNIKCYDINSAYPYAMIQKLPVGKPLTLEEVSEKKGDVAILYYIRFKKGRLRDDLVPIIRNYMMSNDFFMKVGNYFRYAVWDIELEWFEKYYEGLEYDVEEVFYFEMDYVFNKYINHWYSIKEESSRILTDIEKNKVKYPFDKSYYEMQKYVSKLMMNSLYGKFGQKPAFPYFLLSDGDYEKNAIFDIKIKKNKEFGWFNQKVRVESVKSKDFPNNFSLYEICNLTESLEKKIPDKCNNVYIASYITSFVRCILFKVIYSLKERFLYSDTDSIYCLGKIDKEYLDEFKLGSWKEERSDRFFKCLGSKCYITSKNKIISENKKISKIVISGVNYYDTIIGKDINEFTYGLEFSKNSSKVMIKGKMIYKTQHIIKEKKNVI